MKCTSLSAHVIKAAARDEDVMAAKIIDGVAVARKMRQECRARVETLKSANGLTPGLAVILVGENPASLLYVRNKLKACEEVGIRSFKFNFPADVNQEIVLGKIRALNDDPGVHGILVQLPLPPSFNLMEILHAISVDKDVDGFHLYNVGGLVVGNTVFPPCTPYGVVQLLEHEKIARRRPECRGGGRQQHRRQTDGAHADAAGRDRLHLPREDPRSGPVYDPGGYPGGGRRAAEAHCAADGARPAQS